MAEAPVVEVRGLAKSYREGGKEVPALRGVDLAVRPGELVTVLGPSGSGKSTLLHLIGLMDRPTSGEVLLFGEPTSGLGEAERSRLRGRKVGFVFQFDSLLPEFTVLENVAMPARIAGAPGGPARAKELLGLLGIAALAERFPHQLSGGERQRAAIARGLLNGPAVLLADEPTGNLDRRNGELVFLRMKELAESLRVAVVLVTHNEYAAQFSSRPVHIVDGRIEGTS